MSSVSDASNNTTNVPNLGSKRKNKAILISSKTKYTQRFCEKWPSLFSPWLIRSPQDQTKPFCKACQTRLDSNKCHLQRHEKTSKHKRNLRRMLNESSESESNSETVMVRQSPISVNQKYYQPKRDTAECKVETVEFFGVENECYLYDENNFESIGEIEQLTTAEEYRGNSPPHAKLDQEKKYYPALSDENDCTHLRLSIANDKKYLLNQFRELIHLTETPKPKDSIDLFFESVSSSVKGLSPRLKAEAKMRVSQLLGELELRHAELEQRNGSAIDANSAVAVVVSTPATGTNTINFNYSNTNTI